MSPTYPQFKTTYSHEELVEHFLLTPPDLQLVLTRRGEANRCGMALLLKAMTYLGYVRDSLDCVAHEVRSFIAGQLDLLWEFSEQYCCASRRQELHLFEIRRHTRFCFPTGREKEATIGACYFPSSFRGELAQYVQGLQDR